LTPPLLITDLLRGQGQEAIGDLIHAGRAMKKVTVDTATKVVTAPGVKVRQIIHDNSLAISGEQVPV
jgi:hypothetical protein